MNLTFFTPINNQYPSDEHTSEVCIVGHIVARMVAYTGHQLYRSYYQYKIPRLDGYRKREHKELLLGKCEGKCKQHAIDSTRRTNLFKN